MRPWIAAARPATLSAAIAPIMVGSAIPALSGNFDLRVLVAALVGAIFIQIGANYANDLFDFRRGADRPDRLGPPRATSTGAIAPQAMAVATGIAFALATGAGIFLVAVGGPPVLAIGLASFVAALTYVGGPWPYGYHGLGDPMCFLFFGVVPVLTLTALHGAQPGFTALAAAVPIGCLVTAILSVNNLRDRVQDATSGKRTLAVLLGDRATRGEYVGLVLVAYAVPLGGALAGLWGYGALLAWLSAPLARPLLESATKANGRELNAVLRDTARLHLVFSGLLALGILLIK